MEVENVLGGREAVAHCEAGKGFWWGRDSSGPSSWQEDGEFLNTVYSK